MRWPGAFGVLLGLAALSVLLWLLAGGTDGRSRVEAQAGMPAAPTGFQAALQGDTGVRLTWRDNAADEAGYELWRWSEGSGWAFVAAPPPNADGFEDRGLVSGAAYWYYLAAYNRAGYSSWAFASVTVPGLRIVAPGGLAVRSVEGALQLRWQDNATNEAGYELWRWSEAAGSVLAARLPANSSTYLDQGLSPGVTYWYYLAAFSGLSYSDWTSASARAVAAACRVDLAASQATWASGTATVSGFIARPQGDGPFPALLVLHTSGGLNAHTRAAASVLAGQGYVALAPDYFTPEGITPSFDRSVILTKHVDRIREHLSRGIECLKSLSYVDASRMGTVGFSLGGYFGLLVGARDDVKAVVSHYGAYHGEGVSRVSTKYAFADVAAQVKARVLMLHGDADSTVRIDFARSAQRLLLAAGKQSELVVYPGVDHAFDQVGTPTYHGLATQDAASRTLAFLAGGLR